jgi:translation initiation factor 5A
MPPRAKTIYMYLLGYPRARDSMSKTQCEVRELKPNRYMIIDEEPCKILSISTSKPGKHGEAKSRIEAVGLFDEVKRSVVHPVKHKVDVPLIDKRTAQVLSIAATEVQLMDMTTYETFDLGVNEAIKAQLAPGIEVQYMEAMNRRKITRIAGTEI